MMYSIRVAGEPVVESSLHECKLGTKDFRSVGEQMLKGKGLRLEVPPHLLSAVVFHPAFGVDHGVVNDNWIDCRSDLLSRYRGMSNNLHIRWR